MKAFQLIPAIAEYADFKTYAQEAALGAEDLILTNEYIYEPTISALNLGCHILFQEKYGMGEPTDVMVDAILDELRDKDYNRIIAVGGGTIIDIAKVLAVASKEDKVDDLYDRMADLHKVHELVIVPTTCGTGSEVTNISIINRTTKGVKQGIVSPAMFANEAALIPGMLASLPYGVFATSSIDAMIHAVESFLSPNACAISELFSKSALHLILSGWRAAVDNGGRDAWKKYAARFLRASNFAGIAFGHAGCAAVHARRRTPCSARSVQSADVCRCYAQISGEEAGWQAQQAGRNSCSRAGYRAGIRTGGAVQAHERRAGEEAVA